MSFHRKASTTFGSSSEDNLFQKVALNNRYYCYCYYYYFYYYYYYYDYYYHYYYHYYYYYYHHYFYYYHSFLCAGAYNVFSFRSALWWYLERYFVCVLLHCCVREDCEADSNDVMSSYLFYGHSENFVLLFLCRQLMQKIMQVI